MQNQTETGRDSRPYTAQGLGATAPTPLRGGTSTTQTLGDWVERCSDQPVCWMIVRLIHCKFNWLRPDGTWSKKQREAAAWREREEAYQAGRQVNGLLYCYDRA